VVSMVTGSSIDKDTADPTARLGGGQNIHNSPIYCLFLQTGFYSPDGRQYSLMIIGVPDYQTDRVPRYP